MWCQIRVDEITWTDGVRNGEVLHKVNEERNVLHTIKIRKVNCSGHILRRNGLLEHIIEEETGNGNKSREDKEEEVSSYWMTLRKGNNIGN